MKSFFNHRYSRVEDGVKVTYTGKEITVLTAKNILQFAAFAGGTFLMLIMLCVMG